MAAFRDSVPHIVILPRFKKTDLIDNVSLAGIDFKMSGVKGDPVAFTQQRNHLLLTGRVPNIKISHPFRIVKPVRCFDF